jgi:heme d1 biosynthesis radical SAM protein NirJ
MFRLSHYLHVLNSGKRSGIGCGPAHAGRKQALPIVIWNLTRRCNLECVHCYSSSKERHYSGELTTKQALDTLDGLAQAHCGTIVFSGGEPLYREDIHTLARRAVELGLPLTLSTNGTLIDDKTADLLVESGFTYIGVSLDGMEETHDRFRGMKGAFRQAVDGLMRIKERGVKVGVRFSLTRINIADLPRIFRFVEERDIGKLYLSHLVYSGRGNMSKDDDLSPAETRRVMEYVFEKAEEYAASASHPQIVTGNNDADAVFLLLGLMKKDPKAAERLLPMLERAGGNNAGLGVANIDPTGEVHPDPLTSYINLGNVTERSFGQIWSDERHHALARLRERPRRINGRCGECAWLSVCGGNARPRARLVNGDMWGSDPACYLTDEEIKIETSCAI